MDRKTQEKPIAFASRSLAPAEKNDSQLDKEGLAVVFGVKRFHYLNLFQMFHSWRNCTPHGNPPRLSCHSSRNKSADRQRSNFEQNEKSGTERMAAAIDWIDEKLTHVILKTYNKSRMTHNQWHKEMNMYSLFKHSYSYL